MEAVLPRGRIRVTGVIENSAWRERYEAQKRARAARMEQAQRERYEARQQRKAEKEQRKEARTQAKVRDKMLRETYKQLGISEDYISTKQSQIDAARANNPTSGREGSLGRLQTQEQVAMGAGGSAAADQREMRGLGKDIALTAGGAIIAAGGGLEAIAAPIIGQTAFAAIMDAIGMIAGASFFGPAVAVGTIAILTRKLMKKAKARRANQADQSQKLDDYQADLDNFKKQLDAVQQELISSQDMMVAKYNSMKKGEFNAYLKSYIADLLKSAGLTADKEATSEAAAKITSQIAGQGSQPDKEDSELKQETPEQETPSQETPEQEAPSQETPEQETPSQDLPEQESPEQGNVELGGQEREVEVAEETPTVEAVSLAELETAKDEMIAEGLIENPAEKEAQIQEQIRRLEEERVKAENQLSIEDRNQERGD